MQLDVEKLNYTLDRDDIDTSVTNDKISQDRTVCYIQITNI